MKGIKDTRTVQDKMGQRLRLGRGKMKRPELVKLLKESSKAPIESKAEMTTERLKQWEYGNNPISLEWLPAICDVLSCDIGYLFGEYEERRRVSADIATETGLTESAINMLRNFMNKRLLSATIESPHFLKMLESMADSICYADKRGELIKIHMKQMLSGEETSVPAADMDKIFQFDVSNHAVQLFKDVSSKIFDELGDSNG